MNDTDFKRSPAILALERDLGLNPIFKDHETDYNFRQPSLDLDETLCRFFHGGQIPHYK